MAQFFLLHWIGHHQVFIDILVKESQEHQNTKWILLSLNPIFIQIYIQHLQQANSKGANDIAIHWMYLMFYLFKYFLVTDWQG